MLEEARLHSAALAFSCGVVNANELMESAHQYASAAQEYRRRELEHGATLTPREAEVVR